MAAIGYIRVSTEEQARDGVSLDMQADRIRQYARLYDMELLDVIADNGISGKSVSGRPGMLKVSELIRKKSVTDVVVYSLSRLARNTVECLNLSETFKKNHVTLHSITEKLDTSSATGEFYFTLLASLAQMERRVISERTTAAMGRKREKGERISRIAPYGYRFDKGAVIPEEGEQATIRKIQELSDNGLTIRGICATLTSEGIFNREGKPFAVASVHGILKHAESF
jgi:site-specific DNA recombinase